MKLKPLLITTLAMLSLSLSATPIRAKDNTIYITDTNMNSIKNIDFLIEQALPNDLFSKTVSIENKSNKNITLYLKSADKDDNELIRNINVKITYNQEVICDEPMSEVLNKPFELGQLNPSDKRQMTIECHISSSLDNQFNMSETSLNYILFGEYENETVSTEDRTISNYLLITAILSGLGIAIFAYKHFEEVKKHEKN